jgi:hypothetical protein
MVIYLDHDFVSIRAGDELMLAPGAPVVQSLSVVQPVALVNYQQYEFRSRDV